jgi:hypothetical protein
LAPGFAAKDRQPSAGSQGRSTHARPAFGDVMCDMLAWSLEKEAVILVAQLATAGGNR